MSKKSAKEAHSENKLSFLRVFITVLVFFVVLFIYLASPPDRRELAYRLKCNTCLKSLGVVFVLYADEFDGSLPSVESWCDAFGKYMIPGLLICPGSNAKEDQSSYAMNAFLAGRKLAELPPDLVLLFESKPGWNKAGGPEILTMEHHEDEGCNVLFADGHVKFIRPDKIWELRWTISRNNSDE
jgi:prepilin-type processing-associated H-X9-DG protein